MDKKNGKENVIIEDYYDEIDLVELLKPVVKNFRLLIFVPLLGALIFGLLFYLFYPRKYKSSVDFVVTPVLNQAQQEDQFSVYFFKNLLESSSFLMDIEKKAKDKGLLEQNEKLKLGKNVFVEIFVAKRRETDVLSPIIRVSVKARTPQQAFGILQILTNSFLNKSKQILFKARENFIISAEKEFPNIKERYEKVLLEYNQIKNKYLEAVNKKKVEIKLALDKFDANKMKKLAEFDKERNIKRLQLVSSRNDKLLDLIKNRRELKTKLKKELKPDLIKEEFKCVQKELKAKLSELKLLDAKLSENRKILLELKKMLKETPEKLILNKKGILFKESQEEMNPDYLKLSSKIQETEQKIIELEARRENILKNLKKLETDYSKLMTKNDENKKVLEKFEKETQNLIDTLNKETENLLSQFDQQTKILRKKLEDSLDLERFKLKSKLDEELSILKSDFELKLTSINNKQLYLENSFKDLADKYSQAIILKSEILEPVKALTKPYIPDKPEPRKTILKTLVVGFLLGFIMLFFVYIKEFYINNKHKFM